MFSIRKTKTGSVWVRAGIAWVNPDDSMNLYLDVLPLDGQLHIREPGERQQPHFGGQPQQQSAPQPQQGQVAQPQVNHTNGSTSAPAK